MHQICKNKRGFTLVEILLVIVIIIILASVVSLSVNDYMRRARAANSSVSNAVQSSVRNNISERESKLEGYGF